MSTYIISGNYTQDAIKGMMAKPSDREAAVKALITSAGGKMVSYYVTTGPHDFQITVETGDMTGLMAALMVAGASGGANNMQTVQAFTSAEFTAAQKKAGGMAAAYKSPGH